MMLPLTERLAQDRALVLDGALGTELQRRGASLEGAMWSAQAILEAPYAIRRIHADYVEAGAEIVTANTFRTHARNLSSGGLAELADELTRRAVNLAREAAGERAYVAGSQGPLEDCYSPQLTPDDAALAAEHVLMARNLADAGVDLILVETHPTVREAQAAATAAAATGVPVMVSFVCGEDGRLLSGEPLSAGIAAVQSARPAAVLVNCLPLEAGLAALDEMARSAPDIPRGLYANAGQRDARGRWSSTTADPAAYALVASEWLRHGARIIGGCCKTTPVHIRRLAELIARSGQ